MDEVSTAFHQPGGMSMTDESKLGVGDWLGFNDDEPFGSETDPPDEAIPMTPIVGSSQIAMVGWKDDALDVQFTSGGLYRYAAVPIEVAEGLIGAVSPGRYLAAHVKGHFSYTRLDANP
jgi:hypothetical protein